jgi:threonine synthase
LTRPAGPPAARPGVLAAYRELLPLTERTPSLSLGEGDTPLIEAPALARWAGVARLHCKFEGLNPTGSFKDRGMVVAVAKALEDGAEVLLCASTGNTAASAAAYAARAGLEAVVMVPAGGVSKSKLLQARVYGARVLEISAHFEGVLDVARELSSTPAVALVNSVNPYRIDGQATAAYEVCDVLGGAPNVLALPVGNGGNVTAYWRGFTEYRRRGRVSNTPLMLGVQAAGADPLVQGHPIQEPRTLASAIRIGRPATWEPALAAARDSGGAILSVDDTQILAAQRELARLEGIFCEPASAASVAGLRDAVARGWIAREASCVVVLTGHGLKDPETAAGALPGDDVLRVPAEADAVREALFGSKSKVRPIASRAREGR